MAGEPLTAAGRALLAYELGTGADGIVAEQAVNDMLGRHWEMRDLILEIEKQSLAAARERIEAAFEATRRQHVSPANMADSIDAGIGQAINDAEDAVLAALAAPSDAPEKEPSDGCRTRGGQNRIDWCSVHDSEWPTGQARCNLVTAWQASDAPEKPYTGPERRIKDDPLIPQWEERRGR